jgi:hypothetical protein
MHMVLEKTIEVAHLFVAERCRNATDLGRRENAEQPAAKSQPNLYLILQHRSPVSCHEIAMQRAHFYTKFASHWTHVKLHVTMMDLDEVMDEASRVIEESGVKVFAQGRPHGSDFSNHLLFDGRQFSGRASCHMCSFKAKTSTRQGRCAQNHDLHCFCMSPRGAHIRAARASTICSASQFDTSRECRDACCQDRTSDKRPRDVQDNPEARFCAYSSRKNYWEQAKLSWQRFLTPPLCRQPLLQGRSWRRRATFERNLFELHRRLQHHLRCQQNPPLFPIINTGYRSAVAEANRKCDRRSARTRLQIGDQATMPQIGFVIFISVGSELPRPEFILIRCLFGRFR